MRGKPPDTMRAYSHLFEVDGEYLKLNKGKKPEMREFLRRQHATSWFAAVADSGQKHIVPWTPVNQPGTKRPVVLFEEMLVMLPCGEPGWALVDQMTELLTAGATKEDITRGTYSTFAYERCAEQIERFETTWAWKRDAPWFSLAIWLAQRDEVAVQERIAEEKAAKAMKREAAKTRTKKETKAHDRKEGKGKAPKPDRRSDPGDAPSVSADVHPQHPEALGPTPKPNAGCSKDDKRTGGMGDVSRAGSPSRGGQLVLFEVPAGADSRSPRAGRSKRMAGPH
jgi:hypothetical protein